MHLTTDTINSDYNYVMAISEPESTDIKLLDYVCIRHSSKAWIGQVIAPNLNVALTGSPFDPHILAGVERLSKNQQADVCAYVQGWKIYLMGEFEDGHMTTLRQRPLPGAIVNRLDRKTTVDVLSLPDYQKYENGSTNAIGYLLNADDVPLCVKAEIFTHHIIVNGGTGSGKSNTGSNLIHQACMLDAAVFLYDAKTDYRLMGNANTDPKVTMTWRAFEKYALKPEGAKKLTKVAIYGTGKAGANNNYEGYDYVVGFQAGDLDPDLFASLFFDSTSDANAFEAFATVCWRLRARGKPFGMNDITEEIEVSIQRYKQEKSDAQGIHDATGGKMNRTIANRIRDMKWLDSVGQTIGTAKSDNPFDSRGNTAVVKLNVSDMIARGGIIHVDCGEMEPQAYALFLSQFMAGCDRHQRQDKSRLVVQFVDEAHRIFTNNSRHSDKLTSQFNRIMVEGRSLKHGVIISLQNASQVAPNLMNNFNSHIVMRQNNLEVARIATQTMGKDFAAEALRLAPGHALCKIVDSANTVLAQMAPSPYELERTDNVARQNR